MKKSRESRFVNAEIKFNGLQDEEGLELLRESIKTVFDEHRAERLRRQEEQTAEQ